MCVCVCVCVVCVCVCVCVCVVCVCVCVLCVCVCVCVCRVLCVYCVTAGLHSSVESDSDGYARGRAYSRRSNVPSYAAPSDPYVRTQPPSHMRHTLKVTRAFVQPPTRRGYRLDVYAEVKESAEESGATSNDAPPPTLDELWAGLNDNQAFQSKYHFHLYFYTGLMGCRYPSLTYVWRTLVGFEQLILQLNHHKEGPHTETQPSGTHTLLRFSPFSSSR